MNIELSNISRLNLSRRRVRKDSYIPNTIASLHTPTPVYQRIVTRAVYLRIQQDTADSRQHTARKAHQHPSHDTPGRDALSDQDGAEDDQEPDEEGEEEGTEEGRGEP